MKRYIQVKVVFSTLVLLSVLLDIKPTFTQGPKWNGRALHNCKYQFKRALQQYTFWLVNGTRRINASTIGTGKNENTGFEFPELYIEDFTPGITYQCGIYHPQRMTKPMMFLYLLLKVSEKNPNEYKWRM